MALPRRSLTSDSTDRQRSLGTWSTWRGEAAIRRGEGHRVRVPHRATSLQRPGANRSRLDVIAPIFADDAPN